MIQIINLRKAYGDRILFKDFNLNIDSGEFVVISGTSGRGKTTLLNMIGGLEQIDNGKIIVNKYDVGQQRNHVKYYRDIVGFLFQNFALIENKTVAENLKIVKSHDDSTVSIDSALSRVGLEDKKNSKVYTLSGGEQQRVALARLMIKKCDLILADEPTGSLDQENSAEVMSILGELNKAGKTILVVTHNLEIKNLGGKVVEL